MTKHPLALAGKCSLHRPCRELGLVYPRAAQVGVWAAYAERVGFPIAALRWRGVTRTKLLAVTEKPGIRAMWTECAAIPRYRPRRAVGDPEST